MKSAIEFTAFAALLVGVGMESLSAALIAGGAIVLLVSLYGKVRDDLVASRQEK